MCLITYIYFLHVQTLSVRRKVDSLSDDKVASNHQRQSQIYRSIVFGCQHANFHFLLLGCRQTVVRNQYRKKSVRHVKVVRQSHLGNAQRLLLRCKQSFLNQTFRHNQQVAYNIVKSMDRLFYKTSTKHVRACIWKTLSKVYLSKTTRRRQQVASSCQTCSTVTSRKCTTFAAYHLFSTCTDARYQTKSG